VHIIFNPLDFMARLTAMVPKPGENLTRFRCLRRQQQEHRALVTPARRGICPDGFGSPWDIFTHSGPLSRTMKSVATIVSA
jgi:hypothetical protein